MFKKFIIICFLFLSVNISAKTFNLDESNSSRKFSLLEIESIDDYFRFNVHVMQKNNWKFESDIFIVSDNIDKKIMATFFNNTIIFTLSEEEFMDLMTGEYLSIKSHLNYEDSFYLPDFRNVPAYERLKIEEFKNQFIE